MADLKSVLAENVRRIRRDRSLTQAQLAEASHRSEDLISAIEREETSASLQTIEALCNALQTTPAELLGGVPLVAGPWGARVSRLSARLSSMSSAELAWLERLLEVVGERPGRSAKAERP